MAHLDNIDLEKTLSKNRLSFKSPWLELADNFLFYFKAAAFIFLITLTATFVEAKNNNDKAIVYFIFPTLLIFTFYLCIRKALEKKLIPIDTSFSKDINRRLLVKYAKSEGWKIDFNNSNYLRARTGMDLGNWGYQITFI
ncbi:hypothetical protein H7F15_06510 [Pontibacter sp. Tf4]|uniref:hypothetical protein n=1 Tax=Pontibacter sp. Tf4 TaxID=2761620 RepID=UPI001628BB17|nr:hypothetical protein [Pontibacter sp. Tf4]MBB6610682.1 hypothetical protein [Pontibacter sp. Tf4]